jgi:hypothetical protein
VAAKSILERLLKIFNKIGVLKIFSEFWSRPLIWHSLCFYPKHQI